MSSRKPSGPSRRGLIAAVACAPLLAASADPSKRPPTPKLPLKAPPSSIDPVVELARQCRALHRENERLHRRYGTVEAWLADNHDWFRLTESQRALPAGRKLYAIHDRWAVLDRERPRTMRRLRRTPAASIGGAIGKLQVVAAAIHPEEFVGAHRLLEATINDLRMLRQGS